MDCNNEVNDDTLGVCLICAMFCHAGHKLVPGAYGRDAKVVCDCGSGKYNECATLNDKNPLKNHHPHKSCSVVKMALKNIQEEAVKEVISVKTREAIQYDRERGKRFTVSLEND